jgi:hypothetical protein
LIVVIRNRQKSPIALFNKKPLDSFFYEIDQEAQERKFDLLGKEI